jgi:glycosyltransferase involved in cell wall biosynthesis
MSQRSAFRIIRVYFRLPPQPGGMEKHIAQLSAAQRQSGIEVVNVYNIGKADGPAIQIFPGLSLLCIWPAVLRNLVFYMGMLPALRRLRSNTPTVLHVHGDWSDFLFSKVLAILLGVELVAASAHDRLRKTKSILYRWSLSHCHLIFTTGKEEQLFLEELLARTVYHLPSAPLDDFFEFSVRDTTKSCDVISVGNFFPKKRQDLVLECARSRPRLRFAVYGDGPELEAIITRSQAQEIRNIKFLGRRPAAAIKEACQRAKVFLSTSEVEGTPTAVLEAMATGLPVVLTPSNNYTWLVQSGVNGFITNTWQPDEILSYIDIILADEARRIAMGEANHKNAIKYTWRNNARFVTELMSELLNLSLVLR